MGADDIRTGLASFRPDQGRLNILHTAIGIHIIDDTYNANPASMEAAILTLKALKGRGRAALVTGDMLELGKHAETMHREAGALAARSDVARIYATGSYCQAVYAGARDEGFPASGIVTGTREQIADDLKAWLQPQDWVLVKGSRKMEMETVLHHLGDWAAGNEDHEESEAATD